MSNEIDNFIKNFEDMFKNITPAQQTQIKNITNNSNVSNDNLIIPKDATPFSFVNFNNNTSNLLVDNLSTNVPYLISEFRPIFNFKTLKRSKIFITKINVVNTMVDTTENINLDFFYEFFINGLPMINLIDFESKNIVELLNPVDATANDLVLHSTINTTNTEFKTDINYPIIITHNDLFEIKGALGMWLNPYVSDLSSTGDTFTGNIIITISGYYTRIE